MRIRLRVTALTALCALGYAGAALAHHSFAMFEPMKQIKLVGTVSEFTWENPHVYIELHVAKETGGYDDWTIECANPGILNRVGWKFNMIKAGDQLTAIVAPLRSGEPGALLKQVTLSDGRKFSNGAPAGPATIQ